MENINVSAEDLKKLIRDVAQIKEMLAEEKGEIELTNWAKEELEEARNRSEKEYVSLENVKKRILSKK